MKYLTQSTALVLAISLTCASLTSYGIGEDVNTGEPVYPDIPEDQDPGGGGGDGGGSQCKTITVSGNLYYNDLRAKGRFSERRVRGTPSAGGSADPYTTNPITPPAGAVRLGDNINYLGLLDATVQIHEVDDVSSVSGNCIQTAYVGNTAVRSDGSFSWTGTVCDPCNLDHDGANDNGVSIAALVRLRYCSPTRCFSVRDPIGAPTGETLHYADGWDIDAPYQRWHRNALVTSPQIFVARTSATLTDDYFQASASPTKGVPSDLEAQAANLFASAVDTTRQVHLIHGVPYDQDRWGEVEIMWPSVRGDGAGGGAHSHQPGNKGKSRACIEAVMDGVGPMTDPPPLKNGFDPPPFRGPEVYSARKPEVWVGEGSVAHEYGHLVHYWQWDGYGKYVDYCYNDPACGEGGAPEFGLAAFKEGWADFVSRVVYSGVGLTGGACETLELRSPTGATNGVLNTIGRRWIPDVEQTLCDLWDGNVDRRGFSTIQFSDTAQVSLSELVDHLWQIWIGASSPERDDITSATTFAPGNAATAALGLCRFVEERPNNTSWIGALGVNGIDCGP
jgi:hypothetical protein